MKYIKSVLSVIIISSGLIVQAQTDFRPGYIISFSGDTLFGDIDYRGDLLMGTACKLKMPNGETIEYSPYDIAAFRFIDSKYFVSKEISGKRAFLEYLINGEVSIYYLRDNSGDHYYIDKEDLGISELPYEEGTKEVDRKYLTYGPVDQIEVFYETTRHIGFLKLYMQDYPEIFEKVENLRKPDHAPLIKLAERYNKGICPDEQCLVYEKKLPLLKVAIEPYWGMYGFNGYYDYLDNTLTDLGANIYLSMPRTNEKLSFKFGIENMNTSSEYGFFAIKKFPAQIQYLYPGHRFKPKASVGFNFWSAIIDSSRLDYAHTLCFNAGFNLGITDKIALSVDFDSEVTPVTFAIDPLDPSEIDFDLLSYSLKLGLYFEL